MARPARSDNRVSETVLTDQTAALLREIESLLAALSRDEAEPSLARVEDTLTSGYAEALRLEAEHRRLERRFADLAADLAEGAGDAERQEELATLARSIATDASELTRLRDLLSLLRAQASNLRALSVG